MSPTSRFPAHIGQIGEGEFGRQWNPGKALADGTIVGYGNDEDLVHQAYGETHTTGGRQCRWPGLIILE